MNFDILVYAWEFFCFFKISTFTCLPLNVFTHFSTFDHFEIIKYFKKLWYLSQYLGILFVSLKY